MKAPGGGPRHAATNGQRGLWFEQHAAPTSNAYNLGACLRFPGEIDRARLAAAVEALARRHPLMCARFALEGSELAWTGGEAPALEVFEGADEEVIASIEARLLQPYVLDRDAPWRFAFARGAGGTTLVGLGCHHIVSDLHSMVLAVSDLDATYSGRDPGGPPAAYDDFARWQDEHMGSAAGGEASRWWRDRWSCARPTPLLPRAAQPSSDGRLDFILEARAGKAIATLARETGVTPFVVMLTALQSVLARRGGSRSAVVAAPSSGRNDARFLGTVGYFVNLLPLTLTLRPGETARALLERNGRDVRAALGHGQYPFGAMMRDLQQAGSPDAARAVQATLTFQKTRGGLEESLARLALGLPGGGFRLGELDGEMVRFAETRPQFPLGIAVAPTGTGFAGALTWQGEHLDRADAESILAQWSAFIEGAAEAPDAPIEPGGPEEATTLGEALVRACSRHAASIAVETDAESLTYAELERRSGVLAAGLAAMGVQSADRVAVVGLGGPATICALAGVLRANAAFIPVDGDVDPGRMIALLRQAQPKAIVLCDGAKLPAGVDAPAIASEDLAGAGTAPAIVAAPLDPAWLMGTSGTTGVPKLAIVPHEAALAHARAILERFALHASDRVLQFASLSFDEHAEEIFPTLLAGARLVCRPRVRFEDPQALLAYVHARSVSVLHLPTSYWHLWMDEAATRALAFPPHLRLVNAGGEPASPARLRTWARQAPRGAQWFNTYGLTEAAVTSLAYEAPADRARFVAMTRVPAGTPLPGTRLRVVGDDEADVPAGETGELWLGGAGVGLGYFDNPEGTAQRFTTRDGVRWLRTGDLAYRDPDGDIVVTGRKDRAIKLRGQRIDLGDVEGVLARHPALLECVVAPADEGPSSEGLELYVALRPAHASSESELLDYWREALAGTPPPRRVVFCAAIPRTAGLKPDLRALRAGRVVRPAQATQARETDAIERIVAGAFARLLQREAIDPAASFFSLGGHSLLAMRLVASLRAELGVELSIADFLASPSIAGVAGLMRERGAAPMATTEEAAEAQGHYPLSSAQRRAMAMTRAAGGDAAVSLRFELAPGIDEQRLGLAWERVAARHRLLAATITEEGNAESPGAVAPLAMPAIERAGDRRFWQVSASILALDGSALSVLLRELAGVYAGQSEAELGAAAGYGRFVAAEAAWNASPSRPAARAYWEDRLRGLESPTRPFGERAAASDDYATRRLRLRLGQRTADRVRALAEAQQCTPFHVLLAAFSSLASRFAASDDVLVGVPVSLREVLGVGEVVGPTLNAVPFRMQVLAGESFAAQVRRVRDLLVRSLPHAALAQEDIAAASPALVALRGTPLPLQFVAQDAEVTLPDRSAFLAETFRREGRSPADLLVGVRIGRAIALDFEYRRAAVDDATAIAWARGMRTLLASLLEDPQLEARAARMLARHEVERRVRARPAQAAPGAARVLHQALRDAARETPGRIALVDAGRRFDYALLDRLSDAHASRLAAAGVKPRELVAIDSRKGAHEIVAALAILKLGAAYVPISAELPPARAESLLARSEARILTGAPAGRAHPGFVAVDLEEAGAATPPQVGVAPEDTAYVLFTSGSTGEPKAVEVSHRAALLTVHEVLRRFAIGRDDVFYGVSSLDFDLSVFDVFGAFAARATLVVPATQVRADAFTWVRDVETHGVTVWNTVPSSCEILLDAAGGKSLGSLRRVMLSGDWVGVDLPARVRAASPQATFIALGGATEAAIWSNCQVVDAVDPAWRSIPYGRALDGHSMFVAEQSGWPAPAGAPGEILIGGGGLAQGYRGAAALTAERFVEHPIARERVYRTGDLGRYFPDGAIEFLGRMDRQVKLHGFRIEIGEIEAVLGGASDVERVLVNPLGSGRGGTHHALAAFVVPRAGAGVDLDALRKLAEDRLPRYMRPSVWSVIEAVPLTANGKVDRAALVAPAQSAAGLSQGAVDRSFTGMERRLALLWHELLPHRAPRRDEDFFAAGGHSLLAVRLVARVRDETGVEVSLPQWLREPTLANLARLAAGAGGASAAEGTPIAQLERHVRLAGDIAFDASRPRGAAILVTGAAGLIGRRLVATLAQQGARDIVCLVRPGSRAKAAALPGVEVIEGDLALPRFGLPEPFFEALARRVGTIFHVGATVNLVAGYEALEAANVGGTHEAIRLAAAANATLHHVSSVGVLPYGAGKRVLETDSIEVDGRLMTGYCESKWVAERLVRVAMQRGLQATIHRPGLTIAPEAHRDGGVIECVLALAAKLRAFPALDLPIDVVSADYVAGAIAAIARDSRNLGGTFHLAHPRPLALGTLAPVAAAGLGLEMQPYEAWRKRLAAELPHIEEARCAALGALIVSHDAESITPAAIDCRQALRAIAGRVDCPPVIELLSGLLQREGATA